MSKKTKTTVVVLAILLGLLAVLLLVFGRSFQTPRLGGSAQADLMEELVAVYGEEYEGKVLSETTADGKKLTLREDMRFSFEPDRYRPWDETMPSTDRFGVPLSREKQISLYNVTVTFTRYTVQDDDVRGKSTEQKVISYTAYEDNGTHSIARATLDQSSASCRYSSTEENFENMTALAS